MGKNHAASLWTVTLRDRNEAQLLLRANPAFIRLLAALPNNVRQSFSAVQLEHLEVASRPPVSSHLVDHKITVSLFGGRYYLRFLLGRERRHRMRLDFEGQTASGRAFIGWLIALAMVWLAVVAVVVAISG